MKTYRQFCSMGQECDEEPSAPGLAHESGPGTTTFISLSAFQVRQCHPSVVSLLTTFDEPR